MPVNSSAVAPSDKPNQLTKGIFVMPKTKCGRKQKVKNTKKIKKQKRFTTKKFDNIVLPTVCDSGTSNLFVFDFVRNQKNNNNKKNKTCFFFAVQV